MFDRPTRPEPIGIDRTPAVFDLIFNYFMSLKVGLSAAASLLLAVAQAGLLVTLPGSGPCVAGSLPPAALQAGVYQIPSGVASDSPCVNFDGTHFWQV